MFRLPSLPSVLMVALFAAQLHAADGLPQNLAVKATPSATSEHSQHYLAKFAIDGNVPPAGSSKQDLDNAWCVLKAKTGDVADFSLKWNEPTQVGQIIYFGRTAWFMNECFREFAVYIDDAESPVASGSLKMMHGPQAINFKPMKAQTVTIKFLSSWGGHNPGAAEIMVFEQPLSKSQLAILSKRHGAAVIPATDAVDTDDLKQLIAGLKKSQGEDYADADKHADQLGVLVDQDVSADRDEQLSELQRNVLLFDVDRLLVIRRHEINASHVYTYHYEGQKNGGGLYVYDVDDPTVAPLELVATPDGQILDCDLSHDGKKVLFSWRRGLREGYHLWTVNIDGSELTQLTDGEWHDYNACWLPDGDIAFLSSRRPQFAYCWHAPVGILHRMDSDGGDVTKLSSNYLNDFTPAVLDNGKIIYTRWEYVDRPAIPIQSLWTINPDGTAMAGYFGNRVLSPGTFMDARQVPGTQKIICTMTGHNGPARGAIGVIDRTKGVNSQTAIENITPDTPVPNVDQGSGNFGGPKLYSCPVPLDGERFLMSARGPVLVRTISGECQATVLPAPGDGTQYFFAQPVRPRQAPPIIPSRLPEDTPDEYATIYLQDVHNGLEPYVERGQVKKIRVVRELEKTVRIDPSLRSFGFQFPVISCGATYAGKEVIGDVDVDDDGSAYFRVPANLPLYFMALDEQGRAVQRMRSFAHFMPGEVHGCVGCHEDRDKSPPPQATAVYGRTPKTLTPAEWGPGGFDYARVVQPILDKRCVECHDHQHATGIDLTGDVTDYFNVSYDVLARESQGRGGSPFVSWIPTYNGQEQNILAVKPLTWGSPKSKLADIVLGGHVDDTGKPRVDLTGEEKRRILAWIDLNVPYYGSSETAHPSAQGCRRMYPKKLDAVLADVASRRCAECHDGGKIPRRVWTRVTNPQLNEFLTAPLAKDAGGNAKCGKAVFADTTDPDYQAILATFNPVLDLLKKTPRLDMPGGQPSCEVNRSCQ